MAITAQRGCMQKRYFLLTLLFLSSLSSARADDRLEALTKRIEELERQQEELVIQSQAKGNQANSFLRDSLTLGGFFEAGITEIEGPDTDLQVLNSINIMGLNFAADFTPKMHFAAQFLTYYGETFSNRHNNPAANPSKREYGAPVFGAILTQGYVEYTASPHLKIQGGVGYVPFGQALQLRELVLFWRRNGPQINRTSNLVSQLWSGIHILGDFALSGGSEWGYNLYTTNPIDVNQSKVMGLGGRLWLSSANDLVTGGLSTQVGKYSTGTDEVVGADLRFKLGKVAVTSEYVRHVTEGDDPFSYYVEPGVFLANEKFILFGFADYSQNPLNELTNAGQTIDDRYKKWEYGAGINWLPTVYTRFRLSFTYNDYVGSTSRLDGQNRDYHSVDVSAGIAF